MAKYALGVDYGSLSARAVLIDIKTGEITGTAVYEYPHKIYDYEFVDGTILPPGYALQDPMDYYNCFVNAVKDAVCLSGVNTEDIISIGIDATGSTMFPVRKDKKPLSLEENFAKNPHAYVKMWKHHGGEEEARQIQSLIEKRGETFLDYYGGAVSSEWIFPKILETVHKAPEVYQEADYFIDVSDWMTWILTDELTRSRCIFGYKAFYRAESYGFPPQDFFNEMDPALENVLTEKLAGPVLSVGDRAGVLCEEMAEVLGLKAGIPVSVALLDAHASVTGVGVTRPGEMVLVMGTSTCHMLLSETGEGIPGVSGLVYDGIIKGLFGYESGQPCVGDGFAWFLKNMVPGRYYDEAKEKGISIHQLMIEKLEGYTAGKSGLLALEWFNGVRSPLADFNLNGMFLGMNLNTKPEEMYLALIEATAYGTKWIIEQFENHGTSIHEIVLSGGIPVKNPLLVQVYADILNKPVRVSHMELSVAYGVALNGMTAAGSEASGYADIGEASRALATKNQTYVYPKPEQNATYEGLYKDYRILCDYFGKGTNDVMKRLNALR